jgi:hypothetical protein
MGVLLDNWIKLKTMYKVVLGSNKAKAFSIFPDSSLNLT